MNYVVKYSGVSTPDLEKTKKIFTSCGAALIDDSMLPKMALVSLDEKMLARLTAELEGEWTISPEKHFRVPDTRHKPR